MKRVLKGNFASSILHSCYANDANLHHRSAMCWQTIREIGYRWWETVHFGTDHEGDCWLVQWGRLVCHRPWGRLLSVSQLTLNTAYHLCTLVLASYNVHIILSISLPWITDGFEPSSIQNLIEYCFPTFLLTSVNTILQYDESVKCLLYEQSVKWL
jgi:hypothetical protein